MEQSENKEIGHPLSTKETAEKIRELYSKGFGNAVYGIYLKCARLQDTSLDEDQRNAKLDQIKALQDRVAEVYDNFDEEKVKKVAPMLLGIKEIIPQFQNEIEECMKATNDQNINQVFETTGTIMDIGEEYRNDMIAKIEQAREEMGDTSFNIYIDHEGEKRPMAPKAKT